MPLDAARSVSAGVAALYGVASGGRVTFETDSPYVVLAAEMTNVNKIPHFTTLGSCGFDLYADGRFYRSFILDYRLSDQKRFFRHGSFFGKAGAVSSFAFSSVFSIIYHENPV